MNFQVCSTPGGLHQGFDTAFSSFSNMSPFHNAARRASLFDIPVRMWERRLKKSLGAVDADENYTLVRKWIREEGEQPFFLWYHIFVPHLPYRPPAVAMEKLGYTVSRPFDDNEIIESVKKGKHPPPERVEELRKMYEAEIFHADDILGRALADLEAAGLMDNTLLVVTGDHGEAVYEHENKIGHAEQVYDSVTRVPCAIIMPGKIPAGMKVKTPVSLTDLFPTILELMNMPVPEKSINGRSLVNLINGAGGDRTEAVVSETMPPISGRRVISMRDGAMHYIEWPDEGRGELYDVEEDPLENNNLVNEPRMLEKAAEMHENIVEWEELHPFESGPRKGKAGREFRKQLKDLGYVK